MTRLHPGVACTLAALCLACTSDPVEPAQAAPAFLSSLAKAPPPFVATVITTEEAGSYVYRHVRPNDGPDVWVVSLGPPENAGLTVVDVRPFGTAHTFVSRRLQRTFETLHFATVHPAKEHP